ncbi:low molecular weight protein arginine phosphatase [Pontibacillus sp. ALD_SL1]|uniref:low molecular weight protein arginine phosphatase n=1 Tax=Pontibacillus sp. ALD_SL1 TaxID=2777185 RepID=UPI001A95AE50|nr:low molecular weight protein arginine phosphatase [Pontibacillus sp. ALD_SL1]QSS99846.1 low molecular weight protein arginine phosphatase [Pontibacillus sp. ALD_SL1]
MKHILFVCTGNTCRSPMAEALLREKHEDIEVRSAGIFAHKGSKASKGTEEVLKKKGISLNHESQPLSEDLMRWANIVLTMTAQHKQSVVMEYPRYEDNVFTLKEYVLQNDHNQWQQLKEAYSTLEDRKAVFLQKNREKYNSPQELEQALIQHLNEEISLIREIEANLPNSDISDPFGGDLDTYEKTLTEIEKHVELLIKKLDNK